MTSSGTYNFSIANSDGVLGAFERCSIRAPDDGAYPSAK